MRRSSGLGYDERRVWAVMRRGGGVRFEPVFAAEDRWRWTKAGRSFIAGQAIQSVVTEHVPAENWKGAYNVVPVPAVELRRKLLAMTGSDGKDDPAARCLNLITS